MKKIFILRLILCSCDGMINQNVVYKLNNFSSSKIKTGKIYSKKLNNQNYF